MLKIILDKQYATYTAGESVSGVVVVTSNVTKDPTSIRIKFEGKAAVNWPVVRVQRMGEKVHYLTNYATDEELYFTEEITLLPSENDKPSEHSGLQFPFTYQLPLGLPTSFRRPKGRVFYTIEAIPTSDLSLNEDIAPAELAFIVTGKLNLTREILSSLNNPVQIGDTKKLGLFRGSGNIGFTFKLEKSLFAPGEFIGFSANLENHSKKKIESEIKLVQVMEFHAKGKMKTDTSEIVSVIGPNFFPGREEVWVGKDVLKIPKDVLPTGLGGPCKIISLQYNLMIKMGTLCRDVPITIGEVDIIMSEL
ncbi:arrestin domain-containing protein 3-like isoform X2 [Folsomia candida]|uniref:arrestin domain-containing protein 3-like isoform X2 n=1 Tax=Folsomia candida TaxID=158441 RepID=UPI001604E73F|nr:arrestin domain-containing protein 3-like isoform X2 [Folsomia candida]